MEKRRIVFGTYDTAANGLWTLTALALSGPELQSHYVEVPGRDGLLDLSTALTDGEPRYNSRELEATFESSEGTYAEREARIRTMTNWLDGWKLDIRLPDDPGHYMTGRVHVAKNFNDLAHASVTVTATLDPWRYADDETVVRLTTPTAKDQVATLTNNGRRSVVPLLEITGAEGDTVGLAFGTAKWALSPGTYKLPDIVLRQGDQTLTYNGPETAAIKLSWREAVL